MKEVNVWELRSGDVLARPIHSASGNVLLREGKPLTDELIKRLKKLNITSVCIREHQPELTAQPDEPDKPERKKHVPAKRAAIANPTNDRKMVQTLMDFLDSCQVRGIILDAAFEEKFRVYFRSIVHNLMASPFLVEQMRALYQTDLFLFQHSLKVAVSAGIIGMAQEFDYEQMRELTIGALCFDIGMTRLPERLVKKTKPLTEEEREELKQHTIYGYQILSSQKDIPKSAALCALQHHERYDGTGYPYQARHTEIHPHAQIVALCDVFNALISPRHHRNAYMVNEAVEYLYASGNKYFDMSLIKLFLKHFCAYPVESKVLLSNGKIGIVTAADHDTVHRPVVKVIREPDGSLVPNPYEIDLKENVDVVIVSMLA